MIRTRVKICGITRPEDGLAAAALGADAIGLVFYPPSRRAVEPAMAAAIVTTLPPFVSAIGLFVDADPDQVRAVLAEVPLTALQFHGDESPEYCIGFDRPYIKAVPMGAGADVGEYAERFHTASALLLDSHGGSKTGGSGQSFDWQAVPPVCPRPLILAGGLNPENVAEAIDRVGPYAVDVSSGVETMQKGIKDPTLMAAFMNAVVKGESRA